MLRVLLCDDHAMFREGIRAVSAESEDVEIAGEASTGTEALELAKRLRPDVIVMDLGMPGMGGFEAMERILREDADARVLVCSGRRSEVDVLGALNEGAAGYVVKDEGSREFFRAVREVAAGREFISRELAQEMLLRSRARAAEDLSEREVDVVRMMASGKKTGEIARAIDRSETQTKRIIKAVLRKLGAKNRPEAVSAASRRGLLGGPER